MRIFLVNFLVLILDSIYSFRYLAFYFFLFFYTFEIERRIEAVKWTFEKSNSLILALIFAFAKSSLTL